MFHDWEATAGTCDALAREPLSTDFHLPGAPAAARQRISMEVSQSWELKWEQWQVRPAIGIHISLGHVEAWEHEMQA